MLFCLITMDNDNAEASCATTTESSSVAKFIESDEDDRISCTNSHSLQNIMDIVMIHATKCADALILGEDRSKFMNRFTDVFRNTIQENVLVNGLPWVSDRIDVDSDEKTNHKQIIDDAILSNLAHKVTCVAEKRKLCPQQCCRILNCKFKHEEQNLKRIKIEDPTSSSLPDSSISDADWKFVVEKFKDTSKMFNIVKKNIDEACEERKKTSEDIKFASDIIRRQKVTKLPSVEKLASNNKQHIK